LINLRVSLPLLLLLAAVPARGQGLADAYVVAEDGRGRFALASGGRVAAVHVDSGEHAAVARAAGDLRDDLQRVTGTAPALAVGGAPAGPVVLVGTIGRSPTIDALVRAGKLDVRQVAGRWETFVLQVVERPLPGVPRALVIAGSDRRGTIYGIYDLSAQIGVSPWYWWADVPVQRRDELHVLPGRHTRGTPAVRYRGIFINDEAPALSGWARVTFGGFNHQFYGRVFELILRLRGNYLWPAMWGSAFYADDSLNARVADAYGVVIATSHHEPMMRAHDEWRRFGAGPWDYTRNDARLRDFWREGIRRMGAGETVVTVGMRGDGDEPMTRGTSIALLERIVADQRAILREATGRDPASIPQAWALYKEVQDYYDQGMRVPGDVTLLFSDDNWGNLRRLPAAADRARPGGFGVYYHFDYVGGPRNYKWLNTTQIGRVWEQLNLAWEQGADRIWIVNVGDIKPMELPISFFLDYAWDPRLPADSLPAWRRAWAARQLGDAAVAPLLDDYERLASRRKPELLDTATYSLAAYDEAARVAAEHARLVADAATALARLPREYHDAFDQLLGYPVQALANLHALQHAVALNRLYARQGRAATNALADSARRLFERDAQLSAWYNGEIAGGKWNHMMDQTHIGYTYWQEPPRNQMPRVDLIQVPAVAEIGVAVDGSGRWWPASRDSAVLSFDLQHRTRTIEVFNRGSIPFAYAVRADAPWIAIASDSGRVDAQASVALSVDWDRVPAGTHRVPITVTGAGRRAVLTAVVAKPSEAERTGMRGFVEAGGVVAIEAVRFDRAVDAGAIRWQRIPGLGRTGAGVTALPTTAPSGTPGAGAPHLEYTVHLARAGEVAVHAILSPSLDVRGGEGLRYAVSFDDEPPVIVNMHADGSTRAGDGNRAWEAMVANNAQDAVSRHRIAAPGTHVLKFWRVDPGVVLQRLVIDAGGLKPSYLGPPESLRLP
jgi:hypothetical protein